MNSHLVYVLTWFSLAYMADGGGVVAGRGMLREAPALGARGIGE
jgi:cytochrome oxidase assembly protein ShyY1